jgi:hypothetical protein
LIVFSSFKILKVEKKKKNILKESINLSRGVNSGPLRKEKKMKKTS